MRIKLFFPVLSAAFILLACNVERETPYESVTLPSHRTRSLTEAEDIAINAISLIDPASKAGKGRKIESSFYISSAMTKSGESPNDTLMYVFNFENGQGFAIIAADYTVSPLIAITEKGTLEQGEETGIDPFDDYLDAVRDSLAHRFIDPPGGDPTRPFIVRQFYETEQIENLVSVEWGQTGIYGQYCSNGICGCFATAIGQIMTSHSYPPSFVASNDMGPYSVGDTVVLHWNKINQHIRNHSTIEECTPYHQEIGALLREIGHRGQTDYGTTSSSTYLSMAEPTLSSFGYQYSPCAFYSVNDVLTSLENSCPVFMYGSLSSSGHFFIIDGSIQYKEIWVTYKWNGSFYVFYSEEVMIERNLFHINWGWDGECNGFFHYGSFDTANAYQYDDPLLGNSISHNYNTNNKSICNISVSNE